MRRLRVAGLLLLFVVAGCAKESAPSGVTYVENDDPRMNAAIKQARATLKNFITALQAPKPGQTSFSIKAAFIDGPNTEHMWLTSVTYNGKDFQGTINNDPVEVTNYTMGQNVTVESTDISDWMYIENKKLVGGYTIRALRDAMSPEQREEFDKKMPFRIE